MQGPVPGYWLILKGLPGRIGSPNKGDETPGNRHAIRGFRSFQDHGSPDDMLSNFAPDGWHDHPLRDRLPGRLRPVFARARQAKPLTTTSRPDP